MSVTVPQAWLDQTVVCIATGPSLTVNDVEFVRGKARVIAINDAVRLAPWADCLYSSDKAWWKFYKGVPEFTGPKYSVGHMVGTADPYLAFPDVQVLRNTGDRGVELDPSGLRTGKNSGAAAINLAVHFGAKRILLLGYDMKGTHFFGLHPSRLNQASPFEMFRKLIGYMAVDLVVMGIEVVNCSRSTALACFPVRPITDVLEAVEVAA